MTRKLLEGNKSLWNNKSLTCDLQWHLPRTDCAFTIS